MTVLPLEMVPSGLAALGEDAGLPLLYDTEITLIEAPGLSGTAHLLAQHLMSALERS